MNKINSFISWIFSYKNLSLIKCLLELFIYIIFILNISNIFFTLSNSFSSIKLSHKENKDCPIYGFVAIISLGLKQEMIKFIYLSMKGFIYS